MATQNVDYAQTGPTLDTGEKDSSSIRPILNGEAAIQATFQRPMENLRHRTEVLRTAVEELKYLSDADRALVLESTGEVTWGGPKSTGTGIFTLASGATLLLRPFMAPSTSTRATATIRGLKFQTKLILEPGSVVPRAYSGANEISVQITGSDGATLLATVDGTPANNITITVNTNSVTGTTRNDLLTYLAGASAGAVAVKALGVEAILAVGAVGTDIICNDGVFVPTDTQTLSGAVDAEKHIITQLGLASFFSDVDNAMYDGDVLAIAYEPGLVNGLYGGRRESLEDAPESSANVDSNLFILRRYPERMPYALPIATAVGGTLRFVDGSILLTGIPSGLTGGLPGLPPPTSEPPARFLRMDPGGVHYWGAITSDMIVQTIGISGFGAGVPVYEVGDSAINPAFSVSFTNGPVASGTLSRDVGGLQAGSQAIIPGSSPIAISVTDTYTRSTHTPADDLASSVLFNISLVGTSSPTPATSSARIRWQRMFYHGKSASASPPLIDPNFVKVTLKTTGGNALTASRARTFTMSGLVSEFVYIAYPSSHGALVGWRDNVAGFDIAFVDMGLATGVTPENATANPIDYRVYRTSLPQTGSVNFTTR